MGTAIRHRVLWWVIVLAVGLAACGAGSTSDAQSAVSELVIEGTRDAYTIDETQSFGEFGPILWGLVTAVNGTDEIEFGTEYGGVVWGDQWGGFWLGTGGDLVYGVTDLDAVDAGAVAAVIPEGEIVVLRQVRWSLDQLEDWLQGISAGMPDNDVCAVGVDHASNSVFVIAIDGRVDLGQIPSEAVMIEAVPECGSFDGGAPSLSEGRAGVGG